MRLLHLFIILAAPSLTTAQDKEQIQVEQLIAKALPTKIVQAKAETTPVGTADDAADDPAIWRHPTDPARSLVVATDKKAGIHVYDMTGKAVSFTPSPRLNNVDMRSNVLVNGKSSVLVVASDRRDEANAAAALFTLDTSARTVVPLANLPIGRGEAYGMCLWQCKRDQQIYAFLVLKNGRVDQVKLNLGGAVVTGKVVRSMKLGTQAEGCVVDDRTGLVYVAEEDVGLWRFDARPHGSKKPKRLSRADGKQLVADAEGLAIAPIGSDGGYLIASSQGDNAYAVYDLQTGRYRARFRISDGAIDGVQETDGLELAIGDFGPNYPGGLLVTQDGDNSPEAQNFKFTSWADVMKVLKLD